ncbi:MAG: recombinase family protein [Polyangiales bacterium]
MRCAIYARRSTEEHQAASLDVQIQEATRYAERKGWVVAPQHVYVDDAVSRAEFKKRPALIAMLSAAESKDFDVVIARDETRLGGDTTRTCLLIQDLLDAGVRLYYYFSDEEVKLDGALAKMMVTLRNFASELEREKISQRTHEHLAVKARRGLNVGGRVYGFDNLEIKDGDQRLRVEYRINPQQALVIREIFHCYVGGHGVRAIAKLLNERGIPSPRAGKRGTGSWSPSVVWDILRRERYRGNIVWNKREKMYKGGTKVRVARPESKWIEEHFEELRIIDEPLWEAVQARRPTRLNPGRRTGAAPRHLLAGLARCGICGGPMQAINGRVGKKIITKVYACAWHRDRGDAVCANTLRRPVSIIDGAVMSWVRDNVLREEVIVDVLKEVRRRVAERAKTTSRELPEIDKKSAKVQREIGNLTEALAGGREKPAPVLEAIADRERQLQQLRVRKQILLTTPEAIGLEVRRMEKEVRTRLTDLRGLMERNIPEGRKALETLLDGRLKFTPIEGRRYRVEGQISTGAIFTANCPAPDPSIDRARVQFCLRPQRDSNPC